ncbi:MAG: US12 family protein [Fimbriimonadaceae bacterium]|nr:US12 family protein [Fimbriimonadaceae bacterium]
MTGDFGGRFNNLSAAVHNNRLPFLQKVYGLLFISILVAVGSGTAIMHTPPAFQLADGTAVPLGVGLAMKGQFVIWLVMFGLLFLARAVARVPVAGIALLFVFTAITGAWVAPAVWVQSVKHGTPQVVGLAGALTAITFLTLTLYTMFSRHSFSFMGAGLNVAGIGLVAACLLNGFLFHSSWASMLLAWFILAFSAGCILYNTARILRDCPDEAWVYATITLFVDILNMFLALLRILGGNRR